MPIQPGGAIGIKGEIELFPEYADGLTDLQGFSHIIVLYNFHRAQGYALQVKPFLGEQAHGVFATRAPRRPNPIGISVVKLISVNKNVLSIENVDMLDQTPVLDIKPYVSAFDGIVDEANGWLSKHLEGLEHQISDGRFE